MKTLEELIASSTAWYSSNDEETWSGGPYDDREEAEAEAKANEHSLICKAGKTPFRVSMFFDHGTFFEAAEESLYEQSNEAGDSLLAFKAEICADLQKRVHEAIDAWQVEHQLSPLPWRFDFCDVEVAAWTKEPTEKGTPA